MVFLKPMADEMIRLLAPLGNESVLDVAAGTGEPGLTIAEMIPGGKVTITDLAEDMLAVANEMAAQRNITNIETVACDVSAMPFGNESFDAVSCRFGFMFFPDMNLAAKEMYRVLKPGGRIAVAVWDAAENNQWVTTMGFTINKHLGIAPPAPGEPGIFRCAQHGLMADILMQAGFKDAIEVDVKGRNEYEDAAAYWNMTTELAAPFAHALNNASAEMRDTIKAEVFELLQNKFGSGRICFDSAARVIYAIK